MICFSLEILIFRTTREDAREKLAASGIFSLWKYLFGRMTSENGKNCMEIPGIYILSSWKHAYIILTPLNPLLCGKPGVYRGIHYIPCSRWGRGHVIISSVSALSFAVSLILLIFSFSSPLLALLSLFSFLWETTQNDHQGWRVVKQQLNISAQKHRLWVLEAVLTNIKSFYLKIFLFLVIKFSIYWIGMFA